MMKKEFEALTGIFPSDELYKAIVVAYYDFTGDKTAFCKAKVKFGSLHGKPIIWQVADKNHAGYPANSVILVTVQIIKMLCFDATEPSNSDRRSYGNNRYIYSNLRQWLNSAAGAGTAEEGATK